MSQALTKQQQAVLDFIRAYVVSYGFPPTRAEIADAFGFRSPNAAEEHLRALERKWAISLRPGTGRGITVIEYEQRPDPEEMASALRMISTWASADLLDPNHVLALCNKALRTETA